MIFRVIICALLIHASTCEHSSASSPSHPISSHLIPSPHFHSITTNQSTNVLELLTLNRMHIRTHFISPPDLSWIFSRTSPLISRHSHLSRISLLPVMYDSSHSLFISCFFVTHFPSFAFITILYSRHSSPYFSSFVIFEAFLFSVLYDHFF